MKDDQAAAALGALGQLTRLRIFRAIAGAGRPGTTPSEIAEQLGLAKNVLSFHLKELVHNRLISVEPRGRNLLYRADPDLVSRLAQFVGDLLAELSE